MYKTWLCKMYLLKEKTQKACFCNLIKSQKVTEPFELTIYNWDFAFYKSNFDIYEKFIYSVARKKISAKIFACKNVRNCELNIVRKSELEWNQIGASRKPESLWKFMSELTFLSPPHCKIYTKKEIFFGILRNFKK